MYEKEEERMVNIIVKVEMILKHHNIQIQSNIYNRFVVKESILYQEQNSLFTFIE